MRILYVGETRPDGTSAHRAAALRRLGHEVETFAPRDAYPRGRLFLSLGVRTGFRLFQGRIRRALEFQCAGRRYDLAWVNNGAEIGLRVHEVLGRVAPSRVAYVNDDPFGGRDGRKWDLFLRTLPEYDLVGVVRQPNVSEALARGARRVARVFMSYDPVAHAPLDRLDGWGARVVFAGDWMPERVPLLQELVSRGVPLTLYGAEWWKAGNPAFLRSVFRGDIARGGNYVRAIAGADIALGLLSKGNRDLHTQRSAEVPFIGGAVLCAERTSEHEAMYRDGEEAVFWKGAEECAERCRDLLRDRARRRAIAVAGGRRVRALELSNDETLAWILDQLPGRARVSVRSLRAREGAAVR